MYIPNTAEQQLSMLRAIGLTSMDELFAQIPQNVRQTRQSDLPAPMSELEIQQHMAALAAQNAQPVCFLGAGVYDHYIPSAVNALASRQEFYTAYTPYQPEISQGTLQAIFEYQSMICRLTGMDVSNASLYDGATALAEALSMACGQTGRAAVLLPETLHPQYRQVAHTYARFCGQQVRTLPCPNGRMDTNEAAKMLSGDVAALVVPSPNFFGIVEDMAALSQAAHAAGAALIACTDPISLGILEAPGMLSADICVGDGQALGNPMGFGGPHFGFLTAKDAYLRRMPGRICGETLDREGRRGYVLTLQTREQHIRREKATSNICSNQALCALRAGMYLALMGDQGLARTAHLCLSKAHALRDRLLDTGKFAPLYGGPFFKEFALAYKGDVAKLNARLLGMGYLGGYALEQDYPQLAGGMLFAVTEKRTAAEIADFVAKVVALS